MRPTQKKWWGYDLDTHLRHLGTSVGPPVPFSWVNLLGKLMEESLEAHSGTNTSCLSYIGKPAWWDGGRVPQPRASRGQVAQQASGVTWKVPHALVLLTRSLEDLLWEARTFHLQDGNTLDSLVLTVSGLLLYLELQSNLPDVSQPLGALGSSSMKWGYRVHPSKGPNLPWTLARRSRCPSSANTAWSRFTVQSRSAPNYWVRALYIFAI